MIGEVFILRLMVEVDFLIGSGEHGVFLSWKKTRTSPPCQHAASY